METFNLSRFCRLCRLRYSENRRILILILVCLLLALLAVKVVCVAKIFVSGDMTVRLSHISDISRLIGYAVMMYLIYLFVDKVMRREDGIRFFMLPATNMERFISLVVQPLLCFVVIWTVAWFGAELIWRLVLGNMFPGVYAVYCSVYNGANLLGYIIVAVLFSGIVTPTTILTGPRGSALSAFLTICLTLLVLLVLGLLLSISVALDSKLLAVLTTLAVALVISACLMVKAYRSFCGYELDLKLKEK